MPTPPRPRALLEQEWPAFRSAVNEVFRPGGGDLTAECPLLFDRSNRENLRVVVDTPPARVLAHAGFVLRDAWVLDRTIRVACVGAVFTVGSERGRGLATEVLADALRRAWEAADLVLISGDRGLYRRCGFTPIPPLAVFRLSPVATGGSGTPFDVREATGLDLKSMAALYDAEDVHFLRTPEDWNRLWAAGRLVDSPGRLWVVERTGRTVAYLAVQEVQSDTSSRAARGQRRVLELAGNREAIFHGAPVVADELLVPSYDQHTIEYYRRQGGAPGERPFAVTARAAKADDGVVISLPVPWYGLNYV